MLVTFCDSATPNFFDPTSFGFSSLCVFGMQIAQPMAGPSEDTSQLIHLPFIRYVVLAHQDLCLAIPRGRVAWMGFGLGVAVNNSGPQSTHGWRRC